MVYDVCVDVTLTKLCWLNQFKHVSVKAAVAVAFKN